MKYSAIEFINDLKEADRLKSKQYRSNLRKKKRGYRQSQEIADAAEEILLVASNESKYYESKDAKGAVDFAAKQYLREVESNFRDIVRKAKEQALKDLIADWKEMGHI